MRQRTKMMAMVIFSLALAGNLAWAQGKGKGKQESSSSVGDKVREVLPASEPVFSTKEISLIKGWFVDNQNGLPPGLAKRETLPPGLQKQLVKNGTLPPGLQKKIQPLPSALERLLGPIPTDYRRVVIAGNVILMEPLTGLIYDVIRSVIP